MGNATSGQRGAPKQRSRVITERTRARYLTQYAVNPATGCWDWTGTIEKGTGYGSASNMKAHRLFYEHHVGPIPAGLVLDHLCRNRGCVNPAHLEAVTQRTNLMRSDAVSSINAAKTVCLRGHSLGPENVYISGTGGRRCKTCRAAAVKAKNEARKAAHLAAAH